MICDVYIDEIDRLTDMVYSAQMRDKEEVRAFIRNLTRLVYDYKMIGMLYDFYLEDVAYHKQSRISFSGSDEVVGQVLGFAAAFPDLRADIENIIVHKESETFYKVFRRLRYRGTNTGFSKFGPATGKSLGDNCLNLSLLHLKRVDGAWKIVFEVNSDSEDWLRRVQTTA